MFRKLQSTPKLYPPADAGLITNKCPHYSFITHSPLITQSTLPFLKRTRFVADVIRSILLPVAQYPVSVQQSYCTLCSIQLQNIHAVCDITDDTDQAQIFVISSGIHIFVILKIFLILILISWVFKSSSKAIISKICREELCLCPPWPIL